MHKRRGFTVVEMVVTMAIMAILVTLTLVGLNASQVNARDAKRKADVQAIARGLEVRYKQGDPRATEYTASTYPTCTGSTSPGQYPGENEILHAFGWSRDTNCWNPSQIVGGYITDDLPGTSNNNINSPTSGKGLTLACTFSCGAAGNMTTITPYVTSDNYVYEPSDSAGNVCYSNGCVSFKIYYKQETDGSIQSIGSSHQ